MSDEKPKKSNAGRPKGATALPPGLHAKVIQYQIAEKGGIQEYAQWMLNDHPQEAIKIFAKAMPSEVKIGGDPNNPVSVTITWQTSDK